MRSTRRLFIRSFIAVIIGALIAIGMARLDSADAVTAAGHCTGYNPPYRQDTSSWCSEVYPMSMGPNNYRTTGVALRSDNYMVTSQNWDTLSVWYRTGPPSYFDYDFIYSHNTNTVYLAFDSSGYAYAVCAAKTDLGVCRTQWHDA